MKKILLTTLAIILCLPLYAANHTGTIAKMRGQVEILTLSNSANKGEGVQVKYNGKYYTISKAEVGAKITLGQLVRTGKRSLARIIFDNGDQFMVSPGSEYALSLPKSRKSNNSLINLTRGKLRAIISKDGPRNKMKVVTRNASMGVRGTDFYVNAKGFERSEVSVIRGKVSLKINNKANNKVINIDTKTNEKTAGKVNQKEIVLETGYSANLITPPNLPAVLEKDKKDIKSIANAEIKETVIEVKRTSKQKLVQIQKATKIEPTPAEKKSSPSEPKVTTQVAKKVAVLEKKAIAATLKDIKTYTPDLYKKIMKKVVTSTDDLNTEVVAAAHKIAPKAVKPDLDDLEDDDLSDDVYDKYFKAD